MLAYSYFLYLIGQEDKPLCYVLNIPRGLKWVTPSKFKKYLILERELANHSHTHTHTHTHTHRVANKAYNQNWDYFT